MIKLNSAIPLYQQVAEDLKNRIEQGEFCSGQSIPSEAKLCEQYEVSRITIRNAIAELVEQEILVKYQGKGVFVRTPKISSSLTTFKGFTYFCQENHIKTYTKILENKVVSANAVMAKKLELKDGEKLVYLGGVDLQLLGLGHNGHIGFNEPAEVFVKQTHCVSLSEKTIQANQRFFESKEQVPKQAYTMGIGTIRSARKILINY